MTTALAQTPLHDWHAAHSGRMVDFAGWSMPVQYESIVAEHLATRNAVGLFDVSHMARFRFDGPGAAALVDGLVTRDVTTMRSGQVRYALMTNESGGVLDDVLVYRLEDAAGGAYVLLVVNADNRDKIHGWITAQDLAGESGPFSDVMFTDVTSDWAMIAVQGPRALEAVAESVDLDVTELGYYTARESLIGRHGGIVSRTGYTGEDGVELMVGSQVVVSLWEEILARAAPAGGRPAGLGSRDTLRLEAGMPLYGHELSEEINPLEAGLGFAIDWDKGDFVGRDALLRIRAAGPRRRRIGLELDGRRVPRAGAILSIEGKAVGEVTSGTFSPTLEKPIAVGFLPREDAEVGTPVTIDLRGRDVPARVVKPVFYRRQKRGKAAT